MIRLIDIVLSIFGLIMLSPILLLTAIGISLESRGGVFFRQTRVGKDFKEFKLLKFRSMFVNSELRGQLTVGSRDARITKMGYFIRKYKVDELPQLINVLLGDMSLVGPRPEVPKYVSKYTKEQKRLLSVRPGITDYASLYYFEEADLLAASDDPERTYIEKVMPEKLSFSLRYLNQKSVYSDLKIMIFTVLRLFGFKIKLIK